MMKKKFFLGVSAIILVVAAGMAGTLLAQGPGQNFHRGFRHHDGWMLQHMTKELNLTTDQQTQIKSIMQAQKSKVQPLMQQMRQNRQAESANITGNFDENQARAFANKQSQIMSDLIVEQERSKSQIYAVLTPEQRQKAQQLMQQREQRMQERMQKHSQQQQTQQQQ
ncbi:MAG TPA: Spy/CpxP family protein refolding chaperone [Candidatus Angelobacter sp.]|jgi:periplasmic protein CpxP/Spy|nr:Spy/CpxP family protein refolding chaperone [Candidatus Angelobacter sp.]